MDLERGITLNKKSILKVFSILVLSTVFVFSAVYFGSRAYAQYFDNDVIYSKGTSISSHSIEGLSRQQAYDLMESEINKWMEESVTAVQYKEKSAELSDDIFLFDLSSTLNQIQMGQSNQMAVSIDQLQLENELQEISAKVDVAHIDMDGLMTELKESASLLNVASNTVQLLPYISNENPDAELARAAVPAGNAVAELTNLVNDLKMIEIKQHSTFSLLHFIDNQGNRAYSSETLSVLASGIYEVILKTNFDIVERHISSEIPVYAKLGYEVNVAKDLNKDFVFANNNATPFKIALSFEDSQLIVSLKGYPFLYQYSANASDEKTFKQETIVQFDPLLRFGEVQVIAEGKNGKKATIIRETKDESGTLIKKDEIASDYYAPIHRKEIRSLMATGSGTGAPGESASEATVESTNEDGRGETDTKREQQDANQSQKTEDSVDGDSDTANEEVKQDLAKVFSLLALLACLGELGADSDETDTTQFKCDLFKGPEKTIEELIYNFGEKSGG